MQKTGDCGLNSRNTLEVSSMSKRSLSMVIVVLVFVLLSLVAVTILWSIFRDVNEESSDLSLEDFLVNIDIDPLSVKVNETTKNVSLQVKRNPGGGDIDSLKFIFYDGQNSHEEIVLTNLEELDERVYTVSAGNLNLVSLETITIIPILRGKEGTRKFARFGEEYNFKTKKVSTLDIGGGSSGDDNEYIPVSSCISRTCADYYGIKCGTFFEEICLSELNCENNCNTTFYSCWEGQGDATNVCINKTLSCSEPADVCLVDSQNLSDSFCYYNLTDFEIRNKIVKCSNGCEDGECLGECVLSSAGWSVSSATEGDVVKLLVTGENCAGKELNYTIYENDGFFTGSAVTSFISSSMTETWTSIYENDILGDPEFYFKVFPVNNISEEVVSGDVSVVLKKVVLCGNGVIDKTEVCEISPLNLNGEDCLTQGFESGDLNCALDCLSFNTSSCIGGGSSNIGDSSVINFVSPTPENLHAQLDTSTYVNVSSSMENNQATFIDFDNSLISWWRMDDVDGNTLIDYMGRNNGTIAEAVQTDSGALGKAYDFDGSSNRIVIPHSESLYLDNIELSVSLWVNIDTIKECNLFEKEKYSGPMMWLSTNPFIKLVWGQQNNGANQVQSTIYPEIDTWTHIVGTYDGTTLKLYFDGVLNAQKNVGGFSKSNINPLTIGEGLDGWVDGSIDDFMIFNRSLSAEEVSALYSDISLKYLEKEFIELSQGTHKFKAYAQDILGNVIETEERVIEISDGTNLINPVPSLVSIGGTNDVFNDLNCSSVILDSNDGSLDVSVKWYKNNVETLNLEYEDQDSVSIFSSLLESENTSVGETWMCSMRVSNKSDYSDWADSNNLTIVPASLCGNGVLNLREECDLGNLNNIICSPTYGGSCIYCNSSCKNVTLQGGFCGDGTCDLEEDSSSCFADCGEAIVLGDAPSNYLIEYVGEEGVTIDIDYSTQPEKGESFIDPVTGHRVTRVSDISEFYEANDGNPSAGFYNGYAPYTNVNYLGDVVIAYQTSQRTALYNLSNYELIHELGLGESHDPRWDLSGRAGTEYDLYYASGSKFYKMNALTLEKTILMDMGYTIWPDDHMSQSTDARYRAGRLWQVPGMPYDYTIFVYDMYENKILPGFVEGSSYDISPDGKYLFSGLKFYFISDLINNITDKNISHPTASYGHNGWSYDYNGDVVHVFQDNRNDWFSSFNPATGERVDFAYFTDFGAGWNLGQHIARIQNPDKKGWALMGTYVKPGVDGWGVNQIFMVELKPKYYANGSLTSLEDRPRIFRISPAYNGAYATADSGKDYFAEAFASIDLIGNNVYVGSNWNRTDNLELYRIELPEDWYDVLSGSVVSPSCVLNSASWSDSTKQVNNIVTLNVEGVDCANKYVNYTIYKDIWYWFDKRVMSSSTTGFTAWIPTSAGTYYFDAVPVEGGSVIQSGDLVVTDRVISPITTLVTKRFGECETCDVKDVAMDTMVSLNYPDNNAGDGDLYFRSGNQPVFYFNLSSIPSDANITKAVFTLYRWRDYYDGGLTGITKPIYALTNPDNTEMWDENEITYNNKKEGVPWISSGDMSSVYGNQIGRIYFKNWMSWGQSFWTMDITDDVQSWVDNSSNNFGFTFENNANFNKGFYGKEAIDLSLRPYLEITYTGIQDEVIPQVSDIQSKYYSGQTFISWKEATTGINETSYKIYRYGSPITSANLKDAEFIDQVYQGSSYFSDCIYYPCDFGRQPDLNKAGISLSTDSGLYVYTVENAQDSYYAVTTVVEGNENREIFENQNTISSSIDETIGIPQAFVLNNESHYGYVGYVMFLSKFNPANSSDIYGLHNKKSAPFLFSIVVPHKVTSEKGLTQYQAQTNQNVFDSYTEKFPVTFYLHSVGSDYFPSGEGYDNSLVVGDNYGGFSIGIQDNYHLLVKTAEGQIVSIGTYLDNAHQAGYSYYSGWNSNYVPVDNINGFKSTFEEQKPFDEGVNVMYTEKSLKFLIDWLDNYSPFSQWIDENRVYFTGASMGGGGSLFMGIRYPNDIAAINVYKGRTTILPGTDRSTAQQRVLGSLTENIPVEDGTPVYDYTNMTWYVQNHPGDYPYMMLRHGKMDTTIKWVDSAIPAFYDTISNGKIGFVAYWDQSFHSGDLDYSFVEIINNRQFVAEMDNDGFNIFHFRLNESYISFTDFSLNENPGDGDPLTGDQIGGINRYTWFNRSTISDDSNHYEVDIYLLDEAPQDSATVTIIPKRLQNLVHTSGTSYGWTFGSQSGIVTADENGLLNIEGLQLSKDKTKLIIGNKVFLSPLDKAVLGE